MIEKCRSTLVSHWPLHPGLAYSSTHRATELLTTVFSSLPNDPYTVELIVEASGVDDAEWENTYDRPTGGVLTVRSELGEPGSEWVRM